MSNSFLLDHGILVDVEGLLRFGMPKTRIAMPLSQLGSQREKGWSVHPGGHPLRLPLSHRDFLDEIWWNMVKYGEIWWNMVKYGGIWWNMVKYGEIWWNMVKYGEIWWNSWKSGKEKNLEKRSKMAKEPQKLEAWRCWRCLETSTGLN